MSFPQVHEGMNGAGTGPGAWSIGGARSLEPPSQPVKMGARRGSERDASRQQPTGKSQHATYEEHYSARKGGKLLQQLAWP